MSVFGNYFPSDVTVIFQEWSGRTTDVIISASHNRCACRSLQSYGAISPSERVSRNVDTYIKRFLNGGEYHALMVRMEWILNCNHPERVHHIVKLCFQSIAAHLKVLRNTTGIQAAFVAVDVGKYSSKSSERLNTAFVRESVEELFRIVYGNGTSFEEWEKTFEIVSQTNNSGYIGFLQKLIASRAKCLLLTGSGTFHRHALSLYKQLHYHTHDACYAVANIRCNVTDSAGVHFD